ncbi:hypothetical protein G5C60_22445 [Streptomyces sp. HC44]|uniref:Secreted protein n=1 Tax=Streptomyces scabichelini TaxID=2711217 RepID=A0A6G4V8Y2_9ACTN|nr:hypothetical protein [Streptomyces scabichelini]NGO10274.1 hypothetical protein [Streptomyces scabichelini]
MARLITAGRTGRAAGCALLATLAMLAVAGCGDSGGDSAADSGTTESPDAGKTRTPKSPPATTSSPSPSVTAADGTDTGACTDGNCEIAVSEPVTIRFKIPDGPAKLSVTKVGKNEVGYKVTSGTSTNGSSAGGTASGEGSGCTTVFHSNGSGTQCGAAGEPPGKQADAVVMQLVPGADGTAILRLVSD